MTPEELAWVAGILEGEGSFVIQKQDIHRPNVKSRPVVKCGITDEDVIRKLHKLVGKGQVWGPSYNGDGRKPIFYWSLTQWREAIVLCEQLRPLMGTRRQGQIDRLLALGDELEGFYYGKDAHGTLARFYTCKCVRCCFANYEYHQEYEQRRKITRLAA